MEKKGEKRCEGVEWNGPTTVRGVIETGWSETGEEEVWRNFAVEWKILIGRKGALSGLLLRLCRKIERNIPFPSFEES